MVPKKSAAVWQQAIDALRLHDRSNCTLRAACFSCATNVKVAKNLALFLCSNILTPVLRRLVHPLLFVLLPCEKACAVHFPQHPCGNPFPSGLPGLQRFCSTCKYLVKACQALHPTVWTAQAAQESRLCCCTGMLWLLQRQRRACARATRGLVFQSQPSPPSHGALFAFYSVVSVSQPPAGCFFELIFHLWPIDAQVPAHEPSRPERRPHSATAAGTSFALAVTPTRLFTLHLFLQADSFVFLAQPPPLPLLPSLPAKWVCRDNLLPMVRHRVVLSSTRCPSRAAPGFVVFPNRFAQIQACPLWRIEGAGPQQLHVCGCAGSTCRLDSR